jgi:4-aminobutyrate aminotransferase-like enzyme
VVDYPGGFSTLPAPDFETWSKAINAGQFPVSLLGMTTRAAEWHRSGIYGNTMTGNPRACEVAITVLKSFTREIRENIVQVGEYAVERFRQLQKKFPGVINGVSGAGLLYAVHLERREFPVTEDVRSQPAAERWMRMEGLGVIHGGENALRFTPNFLFTKSEVDLQVDALDRYLTEYSGGSASPVGTSITVAKRIIPAAVVGHL